MLRRGEENRRETPYFSVCCFPCRFAETSLKPTYLNVDLCKPQTRRTSGETAGRSWTGYRTSGRRSGRSGGRGREEECFHASREIPRSQPLPPRAETCADLRPCPSKKTKSKKQTNVRVYHKRVSLKIHALLDPSVPETLSPINAVHSRSRKARLSLFAPKEPEKKKTKPKQTQRPGNRKCPSRRPGAARSVTSSGARPRRRDRIGWLEGGSATPPDWTGSELQLRAQVTGGNRGSTVGSGLGPVASHVVACE